MIYEENRGDSWHSTIYVNGDISSEAVFLDDNGDGLVINMPEPIPRLNPDTVSKLCNALARYRRWARS